MILCLHPSLTHSLAFNVPPLRLALYSFSHFCSPVDAKGMKEFLQKDDVDVWRVAADGTADVRIKEGLLQESEKTKMKCVKIANVEDLVQQFENMTIKREVGKAQEWFEEYVSDF